MEFTEIPLRHLATALGAQVVTASLRGAYAARVRWFVDMPSGSPGGVHLYAMRQSTLPHTMLKHTLSGGRATDIAKAHHQHTGFVHADFSSSAQTRAKSSAVSTPPGTGTQAGATWMR